MTLLKHKVVYTMMAPHYIVDEHHPTVATKILGKGTGLNIGVPTQQMPSATNIHWYKHWYESGKKSIKIVD